MELAFDPEPPAEHADALRLALELAVAARPGAVSAWWRAGVAENLREAPDEAPCATP